MSFVTILSAATQLGGQAAEVPIPWVRIVLAFLFCILVAVGAIATLRIRQGRLALPNWRRQLTAGLSLKSRSRLTILDRIMVAPGHQVVLFQCDAKSYLLHLGPQGAKVIDTLPASEAHS